jgi:hypothetical protein
MVVAGIIALKIAMWMRRFTFNAGALLAGSQRRFRAHIKGDVSWASQNLPRRDLSSSLSARTAAATSAREAHRHRLVAFLRGSACHSNRAQERRDAMMKSTGLVSSFL